MLETHFTRFTCVSVCPLQKARIGCRTRWNCSCPLVRVSGAIGRSRSPPRWENWSWPRDCPVRWDCNVQFYLRAIRRVTNVPAAVAAAAIPRAFHGTAGTYIARLHPIRELSWSFDWGSVNSSNLYGCSFFAIVVTTLSGRWQCRDGAISRLRSKLFRKILVNFSLSSLSLVQIYYIESLDNELIFDS